ncbi:MAG: phospholipase D-like domain-containing protein [Methanocorpusculum sp.]|nr:phospholipase D-like domain-containing protein [Methanocorpusculum sp.]
MEPLPDTWKDEDITRPVLCTHRLQCRSHPSHLTGHQCSHPSSDTKRRGKIDLQQAYIFPYPGGVHNIWLDFVFEAGGRGIPVRVMLDGMYYNTDGDMDNDEIVANINRMSKKRQYIGISTAELHNKGVIVDMKYVLVSLINWNYNYTNNNLEAGIIIKIEKICGIFFRNIPI